MFQPAAASTRPPMPAQQGGGMPQMRPHPPIDRKNPRIDQSHPAINPGNQFQALLIGRLKKLSPQDASALANGISPQAAAVLKKVLPELAFIIDALGQQAGQPIGAQPGAQVAAAEPAGDDQAGGTEPADDEQPEAPPPPDGATPLKPAGNKFQPKSRLGSV